MSGRFKLCRWSLFVELDPYEVAAQDVYPMSELGEKAELERYLLRQFSRVSEALDTVMRTHDDGRIEITAGDIEFMGNVIQWITFHTIPREMRLVRNEERPK